MKLCQILLSSLTLILASISVALYYNITFFGKALVALPSFPITAGCLFYYLSAFNSTPPVAQVILWTLSFLIAGWIWWWALERLWLTRWGGQEPLPLSTRCQLQRLPLVYVVPLPWLLWVHAQSATGLSWTAFTRAILVRDGLYWSSQGSEGWLNATYLVLAAVETLATFILLRKVPGVGWPTLGRVVLLAGMGAMVLLCALAQFADLLH